MAVTSMSRHVCSQGEAKDECDVGGTYAMASLFLLGLLALQMDHKCGMFLSHGHLQRLHHVIQKLVIFPMGPF